MNTRHVRLIAALAAVVACLCATAGLAGVASADEAGTSGFVTTLVPKATGLSSATSAVGPVTQSSTPDEATCSTPGGYGYIRNQPGGYVIGNCLNGGTFYRNRCNDATCFWSFGYYGGNYASCGWLQTDYANGYAYTGHGHCATQDSLPLNQFASVINCPPNTCSDGNNAVMNNCYMHANVRPWTTPSEQDTIRLLPEGTPVRWRYLSKDGTEIMIHDYTHDAVGGNWGFVNRICIRDFDSYHLQQPGLYYP